MIYMKLPSLNYIIDNLNNYSRVYADKEIISDDEIEFIKLKVGYN